MEFGIAFVLGGVSTGVTVAKWSSVVKAAQFLAAKGQAAIEGTFTKQK
jgi:coenzyme F420-reducing hydrogenase gamma subunit